MFENELVGLGIVTYNRESFFKQFVASVAETICDHIVVVNDGTPYSADSYPLYVELIQHEKNISVGKSKNDAMKYLMDKGCKHVFLVEDDIIVKDPEIFEKYIELSKITKISHLNFAIHGPANIKDGKPNPRIVI